LQSRWTPAPDIELFTDASGSIGWGAYYSGQWIQGRWSACQQEMTIEWKLELYAILVAGSTWGERWQTMRIMLRCDNEAIVACIKSGTSKAPLVMSLLREWWFICARFNFTASACHVPGKCNPIADALSRFDTRAFRQAAPHAEPHPSTPVLPAV